MMQTPTRGANSLTGQEQHRHIKKERERDRT